MIERDTQRRSLFAFTPLIVKIVVSTADDSFSSKRLMILQCICKLSESPHIFLVPFSLHDRPLSEELLFDDDVVVFLRGQSSHQRCGYGSFGNCF